jgi:hypothetical protein
MMNQAVNEIDSNFKCFNHLALVFLQDCINLMNEFIRMLVQIIPDAIADFDSIE